MTVTGLMFYNARYYDPVARNFVSPDTIIPDPASTLGWNRYSYVNNNPINYSDPSGHCPYGTDPQCAGGGAASASRGTAPGGVASATNAGMQILQYLVDEMKRDHRDANAAIPLMVVPRSRNGQRFDMKPRLEEQFRSHGYGDKKGAYRVAMPGDPVHEFSWDLLGNLGGDTQRLKC